MKVIWFKFLAAGLILFTVLGCSAINQIRKEIDKTQKPQVIISTDGKAQITVPGTWKQETELNELATLQVSNPFSDLYVIAIPNSKEDFTDEFNLDKITDLSREEMSNNVSNAETTNPVPTIVNGAPARQFEINGTVEGIKARYIYTVVDAPSSYYQILAWTTASKFESNKNTLLEVVNSFKETGAATVDEPPPPPAPANPPASK